MGPDGRSATDEPAAEWRRIQTYFTETSGDWAAFYRERSARSYNYRARGLAALRLLHRVARRSGRGRLLEIGCGAGVQAGAAARRGWQVVGVDLSEGMLREAAEATPDGLWVVASADALPFRPGTFDVVMLLGVLEYFTDPAETLRGIRNVVRGTGHIVISSWANQTCLLDQLGAAVSAIPDRLYLAIKRVVTRKPMPEQAPPPETTFINQYSEHRREPALRQLLSATGWKPLRAWGTNYGRFRFMGKRLWPERFDELLSDALAQIARLPGGRFLRRTAMTAVVLGVSTGGLRSARNQVSTTVR